MKYEITLHVTGDPVHEGRISAFKEVADALRKTAKGFPPRQIDAIVFRMAARVAEDLWLAESSK